VGEEDDGAGPSSVVDFSLLSPPALMRYVKHYKLDVPASCDKARLVRAVEEHFSVQLVDEVRPPVRLTRHMTHDTRGPSIGPAAALPWSGGERRTQLAR